MEEVLALRGAETVEGARQDLLADLRGHLKIILDEVLCTLHHVCQDECEEIVDETLKNIKRMTHDIGRRAVPSAETCADRVVRKVEVEILGCCGRSCAAPAVMTKYEKDEWLQGTRVTLS